MDLRQKKTERSIINAFLSMRSKMPLEKITVRELAQRAEIHKATFYLHYHDIYALSESLEREVVDEIFSGLSCPADILRDTERFNEELYCLLISHQNLLGILFSGSRAGSLVNLLEERIKSYIFELHPAYKNDLEKNVVLTYLIQGGYRAYMQYAQTDSKRVMFMINTVASSVLRLCLSGDLPEISQDPEDLPEK